MTANAQTANTSSQNTVDWGRSAYAEAWKQQEAWVAERIDGTRGDTLIFTEHNPVFTMGLRGGSDQHLVWGPTQLAKEGVEVSKTNRGGDITYHGPGQIVGYPIVSIDRRRDLHAYLRFLEEVLIRSVAHYGLKATRREGKTGIWLENRKIAAIGVAVRRWVTFHGFALNVNTDLRHFMGIIPCGIAAQDGTVTSLSAELKRPVDQEEVKKILEKEFWALFPRFLEGQD